MLRHIPMFDSSRTTLLAGLLAALSIACSCAEPELEVRLTEERPTESASTSAVFAAGCFWCVESGFEGLAGVESVVSGYTGGHTDDPTYDKVNTNTTGHVEAVRVAFDPDVVTYSQLLDVFWHNVDPTDSGGQFCDRGPSYVSAIFVLDPGQRAAAEASVARAREQLRVDAPIVTPIRDGGAFYIAEEYHQDYGQKNPKHYQRYRLGCGRDARLEELWGEAPQHR